MKCPRCDGMGRLVRLSIEEGGKSIDLLGSTDESRIKFAPCPDCEGTGEVEDRAESKRDA